MRGCEIADFVVDKCANKRLRSAATSAVALNGNGLLSSPTATSFYADLFHVYSSSIHSRLVASKHAERQPSLRENRLSVLEGSNLAAARHANSMLNVVRA